MTARTYSEFLATKNTLPTYAGPELDHADIHPLLHDWQNSITRWAAHTGRAALFADCGLGKTLMQLEWARTVADTSLIIAPLSVARQTVREAAKIDIDISYVRTADDIDRPGIWITNYEMVDGFDPAAFDAVVLDESSILKNHTGMTRTRLIDQWAGTHYRLCCTATPAPNDVTELCNHAEFLGVMPRNEMLAAYFVHDQDGWRLKGHAVDPMYKWMTSWAVAIRKPSDLGYPDTGYDLPPLNIHGQIVRVETTPNTGQLFATDLGGLGGRHAMRRSTLDARTKRAAELANSYDAQWIVWCGLNDEATACADMIGGAVDIPGSWTPHDKAEALEAFQDGHIRVLVTKPSIAGFGMNFQNCHSQIFVGLSDSYESYYQAIRRSWRFGQSEPVDVHIVVSELEQQIVDNVRQKEEEAAHMNARLVSHVNRETHVL